MKTVYVAGNLLVEKDSLPVRIMPKLREIFPKVEFLELDPTDMPDERELVIVDTVTGIESVKVFADIDDISTQKMLSMHDFDLGTTLKLMKKAGRLDSVKIIGVPVDMEESEAIEQVSGILENLGDDEIKVHRMSLNDGAFERIKSGKKKIEIRLFGEKRRAVRVGDIIIFSKLPCNNEEIKTKVAGIFHFKTFKELVDNFCLHDFGRSEDFGKEKYLEKIYEIYTPEEEKKYGALAIRIRLI